MTPSQIALTLEIVAYMPVGITVVPLGCISDMKYKERVGKETRQNLVFLIVIKCPNPQALPPVDLYLISEKSIWKNQV